ANGCWDLVVDVVGCSRDGERGRKTRESRVYRVWREALCCAQCFKCRVIGEVLFGQFTTLVPVVNKDLQS
nr:hypothetical protein [Tanacetum cinerariifolium]